MLFVCADFPEELSKCSLVEQPSPLYCETKTDLWRHINDTELEEPASDSGYHRQLSRLPAVNQTCVPVINPLMIVSRELTHSDLHNVVINDGRSIHHRRDSDVVDETADLSRGTAAAEMLRKSNVNYRQHSTTGQMSASESTQPTINVRPTVSHFISLYLCTSMSV